MLNKGHPAMTLLATPCARDFWISCGYRTRHDTEPSRDCVPMRRVW
jgi:hypothetical protein